MTFYTTSKPTGTEAARLAAGVGVMLTRAREATGLSRSQLAARSGCKPATVAGIERGRQRPKWATLLNLAAALHPDDPDRATAFAHALADAAGPSLAAPPGMPYAVTREAVVTALTRSAGLLGMDLDDDHVRHIVVEQIRVAVGAERDDGQVAAIAAGNAFTLNGGRP